MKIEVEVHNKGERDSDEVVQIYGSHIPRRVKRAQKQLLAFRRVHVKAGMRVTISFEVPVQKLALWDVTRDRYCLETATWAILAGRSSADIRQSADIEIEGETIPDRPLHLLTFAENYDACAGVLLDECLEGRRQFGQSLRKNLYIERSSRLGSLSTIMLFKKYKDLKPNGELLGKRADWRFVPKDWRANCSVCVKFLDLEAV